MKSLIVAFGLSLFLAVPQDLGDNLKKMKRLRDDVPQEVLQAVADEGSEEALDGLLEYYPSLATIYARVQVLALMPNFDDLAGRRTAAAEFLTQTVGNTDDPEIRDAGLAALSECSTSGAHHLRLLVESSLAFDVRERALALYLESSAQADLDFLRGLYEMPGMAHAAKGPKPDKKKRKRRKKSKAKNGEAPVPEESKAATKSTVIRELALAAFGPHADVKDLERYLEQEKSPRLFGLLLRVLADKDAPKIGKRAEQILAGRTLPGEVRVVAAEILAKAQGIEMLPVFVDLAKAKATTPVALNWAMARLLREMDPALVTAELMGRLAKSRGNERIFILNAMPVPCGIKVIKKAKKSLKSKDFLERIATVRFLARAGGPDALRYVEKGIAKEKDSAALSAYIEGLGELHGHSEEWIKRLLAWSDTGKPGIKTAASMEIMRMGRVENFDRIMGWLGDPSWSVRQAALQSLEGMQHHRVLQPIIKRMPEENGRLLFEFGETLFRLTGKNYRTNARNWQAWYDKEGGDSKLLSAEQLLEAQRKRALKVQKQRTRTTRFFGMEIRSARVIFVVDVSGSMEEVLKGQFVGEKGEVRLLRAKKELVSAIEGLKKGTRFDVIAFSGGVSNWASRALVDPEDPDREEAAAWVQALGAGGGTNLFGAIERAFEDPDVDTIMVLSDGLPSVGDFIDPGSIRAAVQALNANRNIRIHTVALGTSLQVLQWLAEDSGGNYVLIE